MTKLTVENVYTRHAAKELTRKHFWKLLGMMLIIFGIAYALTFGGVALLALMTGASVETTVTSYSMSAEIDPMSAGAGFMVGYVVLMLVVSLVGGGLGMGMTSAMIDLCRGNETVKVSRVFSRMRYCLKVFGLGLWVGFKTMLWMLPGLVIIYFFTGAILVSGNPNTMQVTETSAALLSLLPLVIMIIMFVLVIPAAYRYMLSAYILADKPDTGVFECVNKSKAMMKGHKWQAFKLVVPIFLMVYAWMFAILIVMTLAMALLGESAGAAVAVLGIAALIALIVLVLVIAIRMVMAYCIFYLKRKDEQNPAAPTEEAAPAIEPAQAE